MAAEVQYLNDDIIGEILSRLRVKDLHRFKSVRKTWLRLISTQNFIHLHLQNSRSRSRTISLRSAYTSVISNTNSDSDCILRDCAMLLAGSSCDGLVCLISHDYGIIQIWNPSIRESACIAIKKPPLITTTFLWFGLHNNDYKLILGDITSEMHLIKPYVDYKSTRQLSMDACRDLGTLCGDFENSGEGRFRNFEALGTLFDGNVHWAVRASFSSGSCFVILSYDLTQEKVDTISVPMDTVKRSCAFVLGEIYACLCAMFMHLGNRYELWILKDYGVEESWTKLGDFDMDSMFAFQGNLSPFAQVKSPFGSKRVCVESLVSPPRPCIKGACYHRDIECRV